jgi:hypothetical protein
LPGKILQDQLDKKQSLIDKLKRILVALNKEPITADINELVKLSRLLVIAYLRNSRQSISKLCRGHGISLSDIAYDCIAELFIKDNLNNYRNLNAFFTSFKSPLIELNPLDVFLAFRKLLQKYTDARIAYFYSLLNPNGSKINRNIKETVIKSGPFILKNTYIGLILKVHENNESGSLPYLDLDELSNDLLARSYGNKKTPELLEILFDLIKSQNKFRKEIKLIDAVSIFKIYYGFISEISENEGYEIDEIFSGNCIDNYELEELCGIVLRKIKEKIFVDYFAKGKLTKDQAEAVYCAIADIIYEWRKIGSNSDSYYNFVSKYINLKHEDYYIFVKDKIEYLIKEVKKELHLYLSSKE